MGLEKLKKIGFLEIGQWICKGEELILLNPEIINYQNAIYAFVSGERILYIGKTTNSIKKRFYSYIKPGPSQNTNIGIKRRLLKEVENGKPISIYAFEDKGLLQYGAFTINLAEGLEKSIIDSINPEWNGLGKSKTSKDSDFIDLDSNGFHTLDELDEIDNQITVDAFNKVLKLRSEGLNNSEICKELNINQEELDNLANEYHEITGRQKQSF